jgi:hypothetical protein
MCGSWQLIIFSTAKERQMASLGKTMFKSESGKEYRFRVFPLGTRFRKVSGVYVIAYRGRSSQGTHRHKILYVGHTEDLSQPFEAHRKAHDLARLGANCICVQSDESEESRSAKERDLVATFSPACNEQPLTASTTPRKPAASPAPGAAGSQAD